MSTEAMKQALDALRLLVEERSYEAMDDGYKAIAAIRTAIAEAEKSNIKQVIHLYDEPPAAPVQEPVSPAQKDAVFAASIEFIETLTGMTPPPIEIAPPEVFKTFRDFTEKVCSIFATPPAAQRQWVGLTREEISELWVVSRAALPRYATYASIVQAKLKEKNHG